MSQEYFINMSEPPSVPAEVEKMWRRRPEQLEKATGYLPNPSLVDAMNVSLLLGQPLLLTGEPGTGKTQFAYYVSWVLGLPPPLVFETKSTSTARDIFYTYDALAHFRDAQTGGGPAPSNPLEYFTWGALGEAILRAADAETSELLSHLPFHRSERKSVVLIDEVDKAPRDFPNDILNEIENLTFRIPEVRIPGRRTPSTIVADPALRPIILLTSNSEKNLPDAFLRRCVYYHIPPPELPELSEIVDLRVGRELKGVGGWLGDALELFRLLREQNNGIKKKPSTAELLGWVRDISRRRELRADSALSLREQIALLAPTLIVLLKSSADQARGREILEMWSADKS